MSHMDFCPELHSSEAFTGPLLGAHSPGGAATRHVGRPPVTAHTYSFDVP